MKDTYFQIMDRISNSSLSKLNPLQGGSPVRYLAFLRSEKEPYEKDKPELGLGTLVHNRTLEPDKYEMVTIKMPSEKIALIVQKIFDMNVAALDWTDALRATKLEDQETHIKTFAKETNYGQTWKSETVIAKILEGGAEYYDVLKESDTKMIVDGDMLDKARRCEAELKSDENIMFLLYDSNNEEGMECYNELEVLWEETHDTEEGIATLNFKAKLDRLLVKPAEGKFAIVDVKTTSKPLSTFNRAVAQYRYHRQLAFYERAALAFLSQKYPDTKFEMESAWITAVETVGFFESALFKITPDALTAGHAEINELTDRILFHHEHGWLHAREYQENKGFYDIVLPE